MLGETRLEITEVSRVPSVMIRKFFLNQGSTAAYAIITAIFTVVPEEFFKHGFVFCDWPESKIVLVNRLIICLSVFLLANIGHLLYRKFRKSVTLSDKSSIIKIKYDDLFKMNDGLKVIHFDEFFSTNVGENPEDIKADSVCGQYLIKYPIEDVDMQSLIKASGIKSIGTSSSNGKKKYEPGTIIRKGDFLLMAFAKLDKNGRGNLTYDGYLKCLNLLWSQIDCYHGTKDVYIPVLGSRITRFDKELTQQELLDIMIASYRLNSKKLKRPNILHIVCREREGFSLNDIFGVT